MTPEQFTQSLAREGFSPPARIEREPQGFWDTHAHPFEARALVLQGNICIRTTADAVARTYEPGEIFQLAEGEPHAEWFGPQGVVYMVGRRSATRGAS